MMPIITMVYLTVRREPMFEWFFDSLWKANSHNDQGIEIVVVDAFARNTNRQTELRRVCPFKNLLHIEPKPTVWQGAQRKTRQDCYAGANAINTAVCVAKDSYLVFFSDVSVIAPGSLEAIKEAAMAGYVFAGSYAKAYHMIINRGRIDRYLWHFAGSDTRIGNPHEPIVCHGAWLYGACFGLPLGTLLSVNGADEACDGMGTEDICLGQRLHTAGIEVRYDRRVFILESEEHHRPPVNDIIPRYNRILPGNTEAVAFLIDQSRQSPQSKGTPDVKKMRENWLLYGTFPPPQGPFLFPDGLPAAPDEFVPLTAS